MAHQPTPLGFELKNASHLHDHEKANQHLRGIIVTPDLGVPLRAGLEKAVELGTDEADLIGELGLVHRTAPKEEWGFISQSYT